MESFQQPAFCFNFPAVDFDPNQKPTDGEQYLQSVIHERKNCPAVVMKPLKKKKKKNVSNDQKSNESKMGLSIWDQYAEVMLNKMNETL